MNKHVDFKAAQRSMGSMICRYILGVRGEYRKNYVTLKQIQKWFSATPSEYVTKQVDTLVEKHYIVMVRTSLNRKRCSYVYCVTNMGYANAYNTTVFDTPKGREQYVTS